MDMRLNGNLYNETFSDEFSSDSSDEDSESCRSNSNPLATSDDEPRRSPKSGGESENILMKLFNRECTGYLSANLGRKSNQKAFTRVPSRLSFCLKNIVPYCYLQGHMFMGLTVCGQFLVSYKVCYDDRSLVSDYNFSTYYKYTLYFWIYRPHQPLGKFFKVCLFDDHGVDNLKVVTMTQWASHPRVLIVHGKSEYENEDSYITIARVPKLGCLDCKELRDGGDGYLRCDALCIKCNLTIHTKYSTIESDPNFNPYINLICPERIIIFGNGFIHMLHIELEIQRQQQSPQHHQVKHANMEQANPQKEEKTAHDLNPPDRKANTAPATLEIAEVGCDNKNNVVARIIADFSECDAETQSFCDRSSRLSEVKSKNYDELIFTCSMSTASSSSGSNPSKNSGGTGTQTKVSLLNHKGRRNHRIVTKTCRNGVTTVDLQAASTPGSSSNDKANAYEFSEDNEKCEKIGTFRKRRLADKKYEFSEDNSENILPFGKSLSRASAQSRLSRIHRTLGSSHHTACPTAIYVSAQSPPSLEVSNCFHRSSPSQGFRSPCGSPLGNSRLIMSPSRNSQQQSLCQKASSPLPALPAQYKPLTTLSMLQLTASPRSQDLENTSNNAPFLSPRREDSLFSKANEINIHSGGALEKPVCTKKFKRRFVEEDDAASVITSEEDDCISPGYHTSLPVEVHGSCYSDMQMISQTSYQKLKCPTVIITQHSFDVDSFTYYAISNLCQMNNKTYDVFYDWAVEIVNVCPRTNSISCILLAHFTARDQLPNSSKKCLNCSRNIDCAFHRKQFECQILFLWNMETGDWEVLNYGELKEIPSVFKGHGTLVKIARGIASEISKSLEKLHNYTFNLRVLDSNVDKSKSSLIDLDNFIEFYRKKPRLSGSDSPTDY